MVRVATRRSPYRPCPSNSGRAVRGQDNAPHNVGEALLGVLARRRRQRRCATWRTGCPRRPAVVGHHTEPVGTGRAAAAKPDRRGAATRTGPATTEVGGRAVGCPPHSTTPGERSFFGRTGCHRRRDPARLSRRGRRSGATMVSVEGRKAMLQQDLDLSVKDQQRYENLRNERNSDEG